MKEVQELYTVNDKTLQSGNLRQGSGIIYSIHTYRLHCSGLVWASLAPGGSGVPVSRKWIRQWGNSRARQKLHYHFKPSLQSHAVLFPLYSVGAVTNFHSDTRGNIDPSIHWEQCQSHTWLDTTFPWVCMFSKITFAQNFFILQRLRPEQGKGYFKAVDRTN